MNGELNRKTTRTVHGEKIVRVRIDVPYDQIKEAEGDDQDLLKWLDAHVDREISFSIGPFEDEQQEELTL